MNRLTNRQLGEIDLSLIDRDRDIMKALRTLRYLKTNQLQRLFFDRKITWRAKVTTTMRTLNRLKKLGLIDHLKQRIGGIRGGSDGIIWYLTEAGARLLDLGKEWEGKRPRYSEPSSHFIRHTLAVSECYVQITEICRMSPDMSVLSLQVEPECWRGYQRDGRTQSLRSDLFAETVSGQFTDRWFIEIDLGTESPNDIIEKCRRYHHYYLTNREQDQGKVFPVVLWIVPTEERKGKLIETIRTAFGPRYVRFNLIITPKELWISLSDGAKKEDLC